MTESHGQRGRQRGRQGLKHIKIKIYIQTEFSFEKNLAMTQTRIIPADVIKW